MGMLIEQEKTELISLTPSAIQAVRELMEKRGLDGYALRIFVSGGGCAGLQYGMALEGNSREEDSKIEFDDVKVVIDEVSIDYLRGVKVDYVEDEIGGGFKIENPNAINGCGYGNSFQNQNDAGSQSTGGCSGCY
jgi:iron-sulfur cluster assembly protein